jgi:7-carboxy-7-deazaguanine synthase
MLEKQTNIVSPDNTGQQTLPVMEHFYTLQGEGAFTGQAAYFIRLAGCDVGCVWCDVKDSWEAGRHPAMSLDELLNAVTGTPTRIVVITGGEPLMHNLDDLTRKLREAGLRTHLETSGAYPMSGTWDWICLSPKKFKAPLPENLGLANEMKTVIFHPSDFTWAEGFVPFARPGCRFYLQPEWEKAEKMTPLIIDYIEKHPQWCLSLQVHKYIGVP